MSQLAGTVLQQAAGRLGLESSADGISYRRSALLFSPCFWATGIRCPLTLGQMTSALAGPFLAVDHPDNFVRSSARKTRSAQYYDSDYKSPKLFHSRQAAAVTSAHPQLKRRCTHAQANRPTDRQTERQTDRTGTDRDGTTDIQAGRQAGQAGQTGQTGRQDTQTGQTDRTGRTGRTGRAGQTGQTGQAGRQSSRQASRQTDMRQAGQAGSNLVVARSRGSPSKVVAMLRFRMVTLEPAKVIAHAQKSQHK